MNEHLQKPPQSYVYELGKQLNTGEQTLYKVFTEGQKTPYFIVSDGLVELSEYVGNTKIVHIEILAQAETIRIAGIDSARIITRP